VISAGANILVFGAFLFKGDTQKNFQTVIDKLRIDNSE